MHFVLLKKRSETAHRRAPGNPGPPCPSHPTRSNFPLTQLWSFGALPPSLPSPFRLLPLRHFLLPRRFSVGPLCGEPGAGGVSGTGGGKRRGRQELPWETPRHRKPVGSVQGAGLLVGSFEPQAGARGSQSSRCKAGRCERGKEGKNLAVPMPSQSRPQWLLTQPLPLRQDSFSLVFLFVGRS